MGFQITAKIIRITQLNLEAIRQNLTSVKYPDIVVNILRKYFASDLKNKVNNRPGHSLRFLPTYNRQHTEKRV